MNRSGSRSLKVIVAASGTGGHLFPALYIAKAIQKLVPTATIVFIGSGRPLEKTIVDGAGFRRYEVATSGLRRLGLRGFLTWLRTLPRAVAAVVTILRSEAPDLVIGVGGYVSVLPVLLARARGIPTWVHEAEHEPGWANRFLARFVTKMSLAWADTKVPASVSTVVTGHPVRPELLAINFYREHPSMPPRILVLGGSQGAQAIDDACVGNAAFFAAQGATLWHQCRTENVAKVAAAYEGAGVSAKVVPFISDMAQALEWADIIISRSGAGAVREIEVSRRPAILIPLPAAVEQRYNAEVLVAKGQGVILQQGPHLEESLREAVQQRLDPVAYASLARQLRDEPVHDAALEIAQACLALAQGGKLVTTGG